jgi:hypothetical protein
MRTLLFGLAVAILVWSDAAGQTTLPPLVGAVQNYILEKDYPELFGDRSYRTKIENAVIADLDGDGQSEVIVHFMPHYRQSPTIMIYRVAPDMTVTRVKEGLAPGPLQPLTNEFLDSHTLGEAVDFDLAGQQGDAAARRKFGESAMRQFGGVVEYANFYHADGRKGAGVYVDMAGTTPPDKSRTCEDFQFSAVREISVGAVAAIGKENVLAAWAHSNVYLYRIKSFAPSGLLDKQMWTVDLAADFRGFAPGPGRPGPLKYLTASGTTKPFVVQCTGALCTQTAG